jgi:hypothetical protein
MVRTPERVGMLLSENPPLHVKHRAIDPLRIGILSIESARNG